MTDANLTHEIIGTAIAVHRELGPGLLEAVYEECLCYELTNRNIHRARQKPIPVVYKNAKLHCGYRADMVVADRIIVEVKAIAAVAPIHQAVMFTHLILSGRQIDLLINFHSAVLKDGVHRFGSTMLAGSRKKTERRDAEVARNARKKNSCIDR